MHLLVKLFVSMSFYMAHQELIAVSHVSGQIHKLMSI